MPTEKKQIIMVQSNKFVSYNEDEVVPFATLAISKTLQSAIHQKTIE